MIIGEVSQIAFRHPPFHPLVEESYPGLVERVRDLIAESERKFEERTAAPAVSGGDSHLWEHTVHVASLALRIATEERADSLAAVLAALFHDAGKFAGGTRHAGTEPEEIESARSAAALMSRSGVGGVRAKRVLAALRALYREGVRKNDIAGIVHDADFLSKFGYVGAAQFFVKSTLRGRTLYAAVMNSMSKELTYAATLAANMRTRAGRRLAGAKSRASLEFFRGFLGELEEITGVRFAVRPAVVVLPPGMGRGKASVRLVYPETCDACGGPWKREFTVEKGIKCRLLESAFRCRRCGNAYAVSFCLPEIPAVT